LISSVSTTYAGGGGGAHGNLSTGTRSPGGAGGLGGGGRGTGNTLASVAGTANSGGGGGGGSFEDDGTPFSANGKAGGSGIVIVRYRGAPRATGGTITQADGYTIHTFTTSGNLVVGA
jgi:hypothetical protein